MSDSESDSSSRVGSVESSRSSSAAKRSQGQLPRSKPTLNVKELRELVELIAQHGLTEFELEQEGFRLRLRRDITPQTFGTLPALNPGGSLTEAHGRRHSDVRFPSLSHQPAPPAATKVEVAAAGAAVSSMPGSSGGGAAEEINLHSIKSPIVGTFYRAASPQAEPFVRVGSNIESSTVVCIIEAMKLMNEIQAETSGVVEVIYVEDGQPVEYGQPLFGIKKR